MHNERQANVSLSDTSLSLDTDGAHVRAWAARTAAKQAPMTVSEALHAHATHTAAAARLSTIIHACVYLPIVVGFVAYLFTL